jgi:hypothetical protein
MTLIDYAIVEYSLHFFLFERFSIPDMGMVLKTLIYHLHYSGHGESRL